MKRLKALAEQWIAESKLPPEDACGRARYLEQRLASSGDYKYSLEGQNRNSSMDPIEDFLIEHKAGHCEYFATALTLMLRHVGIPARLVVGFKCNEWHEAEQCYQVRQLHAHTWVQAYMTYDQLPKESLHGEDYWEWKKFGGWLRLDPTPGRDDTANQGFFAPVTKGLQWLDFVWSYYVVELNYDRQRRAIFTPIKEFFSKWFYTLTDSKTWWGLYYRIGEALHRSGAAGVIAWVLLILCVAAVFALVALLSYLFWRLGRRIGRAIAARRGRRRRGPRIEVEFYRRLEHLFEKRGVSRPLGQTPREFAATAGRWLAAETGEPRFFALPAVVVSAYYDVRFGRMDLESARSQEIERVIKEIEIRVRK